MASKIAKNFAWIFAISGSALSLILGYEFKTVEIYSYNTAEFRYNYTALFLGLLTTLIITAFFVLFHCHLKNQEILLEKIEKSSFDFNSKKTDFFETPKYNDDVHKWRCNRCNSIIDSYPCHHCGANE